MTSIMVLKIFFLRESHDASGIDRINKMIVVKNDNFRVSHIGDRSIIKNFLSITLQ